MRVERALLEELSEKKFNIGYQGEQNHTQVIISCPIMFRDYPDAVASMVVKPPQGDLYPVSLTRDGNDLTWDVSDADVAIPGEGILQLTFTDGEGEEAEIIKTVYGAYSVNASLVADGEAPDPVQSWLDEAGAALATFENEIGDIRKITTATDADEGKALSPKTVVNGKVSEWEYIDLADPEVVTQAIDDWLDDHPEATTTVQDGAITEAKLNSTLVDDLAWQDDVDELKSAITQEKAPVILDTASGEIVTVPDGADGMKVETLTVAIEPVQDLHGQDAPYPAGGGKNLFDGETKHGYIYNGTYYASDDYWCNKNDIPVKPNTTYIFSGVVSNGQICCYNSSKQYTGDVFSPNASFTTPANCAYISIYNPISTENNNKQLEEGSTATAWSPYSNLCPISGWSAAEVVRTGKNIIKSVFKGFPNTSSGKILIDNDTESVIFYAVEGTYYTISEGSTTNRTIICRIETDEVVTGMTYSDYVDLYNAASRNTWLATFTGWAVWYRNSSAITGYENSVQVEVGTVATSYEAYTAQMKTYNFPTPPGTVYGGTLTVNADGTGKLVVDKELVTYDGSSDEGWNQNGDIGVFIYVSNNIGFVTNKYKVIAPGAGTSLQNGQANYNSARNAIQVRDDRALLVSAFKTLLESENLQILYDLVTPITYNLTALEVIELLKGVNNLWADCGNVSIEYPCDTKLYVDKKIMEAIANALNA